MSCAAQGSPISARATKVPPSRKSDVGARDEYVTGASTKSVGVVLVGDREDVVEDRDALVELLARNRERRADHDHVPVRHEVEAAIERCLGKARHRRRRLAARVERDERLACLARGDELEAPEAAEPAHFTDRRMLLREPLERLVEDRPE